MKKTLLLLALLLLVGFIAYKLIPTNSGVESKSSFGIEDRQFAIEDIDEVAKISIQRGREDGYILHKKGDRWYLNNEHLVSPTRMPQVLQIISKVRVNTIPAQAAVPNILKFMETKGIRMKIYDKSNNLMRSYTIGSESSKQEGTYFLMDGYKQPYNMYIPGFKGIIRPRLLQPIDNWKDRTLFSYRPKDIKSIEVEYPKSKSESFVLNMKNGNAEVKPLSQFTAPFPENPNPDKVKAYLGSFGNVMIEAYDNNNMRKDTILTFTPFARVTIEDVAGNKRTNSYLPFIDILDDDIQIDQVEDLIDVERYFVKEKDGDLMVTQHRMTKDIFVPYSFFFGK